MIDTKALRDIAQSVASDEWMVIDDGDDKFQVIVSESLEDGGGGTYCSYQSVADEVVNRKTANFIAAFNPATVLALLDELEATKK
ncbi:ead/Ea22-like family protein [Salmonella enterica]|nr:ead/Ea22-like family protein [Salmonella enterica]